MEPMNSISYILDIGRKIDSREKTLEKLISRGKCLHFARPISSSAKISDDSNNLFIIVIKSGTEVLSRYLVSSESKSTSGQTLQAETKARDNELVCFTDSTELILYFHYIIAGLKKKEGGRALNVSLSALKVQRKTGSKDTTLSRRGVSSKEVTSGEAPFGRKVKSIEVGGDLHKFGVTFSTFLDELGL